MPISCPGGGPARYRYKKGTDVRLAFCGNDVVEVKKGKGPAKMVDQEKDMRMRHKVATHKMGRASS